MDPFTKWVRMQWAPLPISDDDRQRWGWKLNELGWKHASGDKRLEMAVLAHMHRRTQGAGAIWTSRRILLAHMVERWYKSLKQAHLSYQKIWEQPSAYPSDAQVILHYHTYFQHLGQTVLYYLQDHYDQSSYRDMRAYTAAVYDRLPKDWLNVEALLNDHIPLKAPEQWAIDLPVRDLAAWVKHRFEDGRERGLEADHLKIDELDAERIFEALRAYHALRPLTPQEGPYFYALLVFPEAYIERVGALTDTLTRDPSEFARLIEQEKRRGRIIGRLRRLVGALMHHDIEPIPWFESN